MQELIDCIKKFHEVYQRPISNELIELDKGNIDLRNDLLLEEVNELIEATQKNDIIGMADGICDVIYIVLGTAIQNGLHVHLPDCFKEIQRSNMTKLDKDGKPIFREDGKILKSELYSPPDLKNIILSKLTEENYKKLKQIL